jgi:hypothetical protein
MLYARLMAVFRPEPDKRTMLPETIRACRVFLLGTTEVATETPELYGYGAVSVSMTVG